MKILVLSLLRLGDIIQQKPLIAALRAKYPEAEIHMALNRQFASVEPLLDGQIQKYHFFDREFLQKSMGEAGYHLLTPLDILEKFIRGVSAEQYDLILNWTHNRLSTYLMGTFEAAGRQGLYLEENRLRGFDSAWLRYFNDNFSGEARSFFHYVELLGNAFDLPVKKYAIRAAESETDLVLLQCMTSDAKKNWGLSRFRLLKEKIEENYPQLRVRVLIAVGEEEAFSEIFDASDLIAADLQRARELLAEAKVLVSGDTSIKHLAAEVGTPTVEISLGGSRPVKTGAFSEGTFQIQGKSPCYPCMHAKVCSQKSHLCAESVEVDEVFETVRRVFDRAAATTGGSEAFEFERAVWSSYLNGQLTKFALSAELAKSLQGPTQLLQSYQDRFEKIEDFADIFNSLKLIQEKGVDTGAYFQKLQQVFQDRFAQVDIALEALKKALDQSRELIVLRTHFIEQSLATEGVSHAPGT